MSLIGAGVPARAEIQAAIDSAVAAAHPDTGWVLVTPATGTGTLRYRAVGGWVQVEALVTVTMATGASVTLAAAGAIPPAYRPSLALNMAIGRINVANAVAVIFRGSDGSIVATQASGGSATSVQFAYSYPMG